MEGSGAEILVGALRRAGVDVIFGVPGDTGVALYDVLSRETSMRHVLARDERSAASMADAYARVTGRVGVVEASSGGGATFLVGGLGEPYQASVPLLVITSDIHRASRETNAITEIDQPRLFSAVTKAQFVVNSASDMLQQIVHALEAATTGRPGPVSVIIPEDVWDERTTVWSWDVPLAEVGTVPWLQSDAPLQKAAQWLDHASRPAIFLGSGVHWARAWGPVMALSDKLNAPVATTIHGKGAFPENHALSLGVAGANGAREYANQYLRESDVVLFVGTRANSTDTDGFRSPPRTGRQIIHVDIDPTRAGHNYPGSLAIIGDAFHVLERLTALVTTDHRRGPAVRAWVFAKRQEFLQARRDHPPRGLDPQHVVELVQHRLEADAVVVGDAGTPTPYLASFWNARGFGRDVVLPRGHGAMGFAIPAAVGLAFGQPHHRIVSFTTDGSFAMACGELETLARLHIPVVIIHMANGSLGWIKSLQHFYMDRRYFGVDFGPVDAVLVAQGFGIAGMHVQSLEELDQALGIAMSSQAPYLIDVPVPDEFELMPPVAPWQATLVGETERPTY